MSDPDEEAIDDLIRMASDPAADLEALKERIHRMLVSRSPAGRPADEAMLGRLADEVFDAPTRPDAAAIVALYCGALVERGLGPTITLGPILDRLERQIAPDAVAFVSACRQASEDDPPPPSDPHLEDEEDDSLAGESTDPVARHGERLAALMPAELMAFQALEPFSLAAIAMLSRSSASRKASWSRTSLRASVDELGRQYGYAGMLWMMLQVLDDEPMLVLHPAEAKGYRVRISGLADNFQLHTLLADALIGRLSRRWLRGRRPRRAEVSASKAGPIREGGPPAIGAFNLWTWEGLGPDGTLGDPTAGSAHWVWNEGVPADIPPFEGTRVVLLGPPPYERSWGAVRKFPGMAGDLLVEHVLTPEEVRQWLGRIASAVSRGG